MKTSQIQQVISKTCQIEYKSYPRQILLKTSQIEYKSNRRLVVSKTRHQKKSHIEDKLYQIQVLSNKSYRTRHIQRMHACKPGNRLTLRRRSRGKAFRGGVAGAIAVEEG